MHPDSVMDAALDWFARLNGYPDDKGLQAAFEAWRRADPAHAETFAKVAGVWDLPELDVIADDLAEKAGHERPAHHANVIPIAQPRRRLWTRVTMAAAAVVLLAIGIQQYPVLMLHWRADYLTATGVQEEIILPDGSRMMLNTASAVSLDFEGETRAVTLLQGEAYIDVVHDASRPFTVVATFSEVEVKGTAFAVRTDPDRDTVVLERGHVDVARLQAREDRASLEPGETVTATATELSTIRKTDPATALAWREGRLVFKDQPFGQVVEEVGRYYDHSVIVANGRVGQTRVNGSYRLDNPERTIRSLATAAGASVTRIPGGILILR